MLLYTSLLRKCICNIFTSFPHTRFLWERKGARKTNNTLFTVDIHSSEGTATVYNNNCSHTTLLWCSFLSLSFSLSAIQILKFSYDAFLMEPIEGTYSEKHTHTHSGWEMCYTLMHLDWTVHPKMYILNNVMSSVQHKTRSLQECWIRTIDFHSISLLTIEVSGCGYDYMDIGNVIIYQSNQN